MTAYFLRKNNFNEGLTRFLSYINFQDLIRGSVSEKRLPSCTADFIGSAVGEHGARSLVLSWSVNSPVSVDDGPPWSASQSWEGPTEELCHHKWLKSKVGRNPFCVIILYLNKLIKKHFRQSEDGSLTPTSSKMSNPKKCSALVHSTQHPFNLKNLSALAKSFSQIP